MTYGVEVEVIGNTALMGVAQTSSGTLLIFENTLGAYAVYSPVKAKKPHVHIPIKYLKIEENRIMLNVNIVNGEKGVKEVLKDLLVCLRSAQCYIDTQVIGREIVWKELRSIMPLRMLSFTPFGVGPNRSNMSPQRVIKDDEDYEIVGWVWLTTYGELKSNGVNVKLSDDKKYFIYNNKKFPPGVYYLIRRHGREILVSEEFLKSL